VVTDRGVVVVGAAACVEWIEPIRVLGSAGYKGGFLNLAWSWPAGVTLARIVIQGGPASTVRRQGDQPSGSVMVPRPEGPVSLHLWPGVLDPVTGSEVFAPTPVGFTAHLREPRTVTYLVKPLTSWMGLFSTGEFDLVLSCSADIILPAVAVVASSDASPAHDQGQVVHQIPQGTPIGPNNPIAVRLKPGRAGVPRLRFILTPLAEWLTFLEG
jgi:hypothetical protein